MNQKSITRGKGVKSLLGFLKANPGWLVLDNSQNSDFGTCPQKYRLKYLEQLPDRSTSAAMAYGTWLVHEPIEHWYRNAGGMPSGANWNIWNSQFTNEVAEYAGDLRPSEVSLYTMANSQRILNDYAGQYQNDFGMYRPVSSEVVYWSTLPGLQRIVWLSKPDLLLETIASKQLVNVDIKSSTMNRDELIPFDRQFVGQSFATGSAEAVKVAIHLVPGTTRAPARPATHAISRYHVKVTDQIMQAWVAETVADCEALLKSLDTSVWPKRSPTACYAWNRTCSFINVCNATGEHERAYINGLRRVNNLEYLGLGFDAQGRYYDIHEGPLPITGKAKKAQ